jgi:rubrerythrin
LSAEDPLLKTIRVWSAASWKHPPSQVDQHTGDTKTEGSEEELASTKTSLPSSTPGGRSSHRSTAGSWQHHHRPRSGAEDSKKTTSFCRQADRHPDLGDGVISGTDRAMMNEEKLTLEEQRVLRPPRHRYHARLRRQVEGGDGARCERPGWRVEERSKRTLLSLRKFQAQRRNGPCSRMFCKEEESGRFWFDVMAIGRIRGFFTRLRNLLWVCPECGEPAGSSDCCPTCGEHNADMQGYGF